MQAGGAGGAPANIVLLQPSKICMGDVRLLTSSYLLVNKSSCQQSNNQCVNMKIVCNQ